MATDRDDVGGESMKKTFISILYTCAGERNRRISVTGH